jgi:hypothetical protein
VVADINKGKVEEEDNDEDAMLEDMPFACIICKGLYREPVITRCGHYFCEPCAPKDIGKIQAARLADQEQMERSTLPRG